MHRLALVLFAVACSTPDAVVESAPEVRASNTGDYTLSEHKIDTIWIYRANNCGSSNSEWHRGRMFPNGQGRLSKYCKATYIGDSDHPSPPSNLPGHARRDRIALAPMAAPSDLDYALNTHSRTLPLDNMPPLSNAPTRIAMLDSIPDGDLDQTYFSSNSDFYDHGYRLALLNRRLTCEGVGAGDCAAEQVAYLALGWQIQNNGTKVHNPNQGGAVGSQGDLAQRIFEAVQDWDQDRNAGADVGRLVINTSLGWHADAGGDGAPWQFDAPVKAVWEATRYAACKGALIVAASGNLGGQVGDTATPLYPAAWESLPAPTQGQCINHFGVNNNPIGSASYARLVYGVGGVTEGHEPMGMSRPGSIPTHVAAGTHLSVENGATGAMMDSISGTSAATAVVSSAAAVVWAYRPGLNAHETMEMLRDGAVANQWTTETTPEYCSGTGPECDDVHIISVCHALEAACASGCGFTLNNGHCDPDEGLHEFTSTADAPTHTGFTPTTPTANCVDGFRSTTTTPNIPNNQDSACPIQQMGGVSARPMTLPMPPSDPCIPDCTLFRDTNGTDHTVEIPLGPTVTSLTVTVKTTANEVRTASVGSVVEGSVFSLKGNGLVYPGETVSTATLNYVPLGKTKSFSTDMIVK